MVERSLSMREVRGSIPRISIFSFLFFFPLSRYDNARATGVVTVRGIMRAEVTPTAPASVHTIAAPVAVKH